MFPVFILLCCTFSYAYCQVCPETWVKFDDSCYKFIRSPLKNREGCRQICQAYNAHLVSVDTFEEHNFISKWLRINDPQHRRWYTSGRDNGDNLWVWDGDGTQFSNIDALWLPENYTTYYKYAAYNYSEEVNRWGLMKTDPMDELSSICEISKEELHQIVIMERNLDYGLMVLDKEHMLRGPVFTVEPRPAVFDTSSRSQNNDITIKCVADGYPAPTYTWYKEDYVNEQMIGRKIDPLSDNRLTQTDGTLAIHNPVATTDRGKYYCTAKNQYGTVISESAQISFANIPEFTKKRSSDRGKEYWGKAISCDPPQTSTGMNFYWTRNSFPNFVEEDARVFVSYDGNLYFSSLEKVDQARYSCNVQSKVSSTGRTGPYFLLEVDPGSSGQKLLFPNNFPKAFPDAPLAGDDVRLECISYGYPVPNYNWTRGGIGRGGLPQGAHTVSYGRVLLIPNIRVEDVGEYICTAFNGFDSIRKGITVSIQARPEFTIPLGHKVVDLGSRVEWTCEAFGIPEVTYLWLRNGEELRPEQLSPQDSVRFTLHNNLLIIDQVQESDQGMYQCRAHNQLASTFSSGQLRVLRLKPTFAKYPLDQEMYAAYSRNITLPCRPEAAPFPDFSWKKNGVVIGTGGRYRILPNGFLYINNVARDDEGRYACVARNMYGSDESEGYLMVLAPPRLIEYPRPRELAFVNTTRELQCEAHVNEVLDLAYIWQHNMLRIDFDKHLQFAEGERPGNLLIRNISLAEAGNYRCIVKTSIAREHVDTELVVVGPPGAPGAVLAEDLNATSGKVQWSDGFNNGRRILAYTIGGRTNHNSTWITLATNVSYWRSLLSTGRKEISLAEVLSPWSTYEFRVSAINELGEGPPSDPSPQYNTEMDRPLVAPRNVGGGGGKTGSLTIKWDPLPSQDWNAPTIWYKIYYKPADSNAEPTKRSLKSQSKEQKNLGVFAVNVGEENYYRQYKVQVQAENPKGVGPISDEVIIYSAESMPQIPPSLVKALPYNSTALNVSWVPLDLTREKIRGKLIGHRIKYYKNGEDAETDSLILLSRGARPWSLIVGLTPNQEYYVAVMAYNDAGSGPESEPFLARTFKAAPIWPPTSVRVKAISPYSVVVTWRGVVPSTDEEPITGYRVRYWEKGQDYTTAKEVDKPLDGGPLEAVVPGLVPGKVYKLRVMAYSIGGDGKMSSPPWEFKVGEGVQSKYTSGAWKLSASIVCTLVSVCWQFVLARYS